MDILANGSGKVREWSATPVHRLGDPVRAVQEGGQAGQASAAG